MQPGPSPQKVYLALVEPTNPNLEKIVTNAKNVGFNVTKLQKEDKSVFVISQTAPLDASAKQFTKTSGLFFMPLSQAEYNQTIVNLGTLNPDSPSSPTETRTNTTNTFPTAETETFGNTQPATSSTVPLKGTETENFNNTQSATKTNNTITGSTASLSGQPVNTQKSTPQQQKTTPQQTSSYASSIDLLKANRGQVPPLPLAANTQQQKTQVSPPPQVTKTLMSKASALENIVKPYQGIEPRELIRDAIIQFRNQLAAGGLSFSFITKRNQTTNMSPEDKAVFNNLAGTIQDVFKEVILEKSKEGYLNKLLDIVAAKISGSRKGDQAIQKKYGKISISQTDHKIYLGDVPIADSKITMQSQHKFEVALYGALKVALSTTSQNPKEVFNKVFIQNLADLKFDISKLNSKQQQSTQKEEFRLSPK